VSAAFTPGPWATNIARLSDGSLNVAHVVGERDQASLAQLVNHGEEQTVANARLIAATPELYEALALFVAAANMSALSPDTDAALARAYDAAVVALRKARGEV
jgi:hypothetical protein